MQTISDLLTPEQRKQAIAIANTKCKELYERGIKENKKLLEQLDENDEFERELKKKITAWVKKCEDGLKKL